MRHSKSANSLLTHRHIGHKEQPFLPAVNQSAEHSTDSSALFTSTTPTGCGNNPVCQAREWKTLQVYRTWTCQLCKEQSFTTEQYIFESADELNVIVDSWSKGNKTAGVNPQGFSWFQVALDDRTTGMNKCMSVT